MTVRRASWWISATRPSRRSSAPSTSPGGSGLVLCRQYGLRRQQRRSRRPRLQRPVAPDTDRSDLGPRGTHRDDRPRQSGAAINGTSTIYLFDHGPGAPDPAVDLYPATRRSGPALRCLRKPVAVDDHVCRRDRDLSNPAQPQFVDVIDAVDGALGYGIGPDRIYILDAEAYFARLAVMD